MNKQLNELQGLCSVILFLSKYYQKTHADEIGAMLGVLSLFPDGSTMDPALRDDWQGIVKRILDQENSADNRLTELQAFSAMRVFLEDYNRRGYSDDVNTLISALEL